MDTERLLPQLFLSLGFSLAFMARVGFSYGPVSTHARTHTVRIHSGPTGKNGTEQTMPVRGIIPLQHPSSHLQVQWSKTHRACVRAREREAGGAVDRGGGGRRH